MEIRQPYLLFLGEAHDELAAKSANGIVQWRPEACVGQLRLDGCKVDLGVPDMTIAEAAEAGARTLVLGIAVAGGAVPDAWAEPFSEALERGLDIANVLHRRLGDLPGLADKAAETGRRLLEVRLPQQSFNVGTGAKRSGKRLLTVGTDCSVGKMYASLAIEKEMRARSLKATFKATGQSGILIVGRGVPVDAVVADFIAGAIEWLTPDAEPDHWDVIEGQGSLFHPSFAGVSLGLLHGAQPDALVLCHEPTRTHMRALPHQPLPEIAACIETNLDAARLTNADVEMVGIAVNTSALERAAAEDLLASYEETYGLPAVDPVATSVGPIVDRLTAG
ncbi:MAG: N-acetyltransferase DgcN [Methyloligellaceae bacterium]